MEPARDTVIDYPNRPRHCLDTVMLKNLYEFQHANNPALQHKSCADIAADAGMSESTLRNLLTGRCRNPNGETLTGLLDAIGGGSLDRLYGYAPPRDFEHETATYDATLMEAMQHQVEELLKERDATLSGNTGNIASNAAMIKELSDRIDKQAERLEFKANRIQEQEVEIGKLTERLEAKDRALRKVEETHAQKQHTIDSLRKDLKRQRVYMAIIITLMIVAEIVIAF